MSTEELELARAAANLTDEDLTWIQERGQQITQDVSENPASEEDASEEPSSQQEDSEELSSQEDRQEEEAQDEPDSEDTDSQDTQEEETDATRRTVDHEWPEVGEILEADYEGEHYEAEVVSRPRYKSGKAIRILSGPAIGEIERSMSGAMLKATEKQREDYDLGRSGVANGWDFWSVKTPGGE